MPRGGAQGGKITEALLGADAALRLTAENLRVLADDLEQVNIRKRLICSHCA